MRVQVAYTVPVEVIVDTDTGTVERVVEIDELIRFDKSEGIRTESDLRAIDDNDLKTKALEIAETADWPAWDRGGF